MALLEIIVEVEKRSNIDDPEVVADILVRQYDSPAGDAKVISANWMKPDARP